ncbi:MAG TPA: PPC domain-containing protein [Gemmatimonadales bacterium]|nr:PPC domain-containing protein [Gemmatimonadales bacterium]
MPFCFRRPAGLLSLLIAASLGACSDGGTGPGDGDGDENGTALTSGTTVTGRSGDEGSTTLYRITVPAGATLLTVTTSGGSGDLDLYVRRGAEPTTSTYDCESAGGSNEESCELDSPAAGTWYIMLEGFEAYSGASLLATVTIGGGGDVTAVCGGMQGGNLVGDWRRAGDFGAPNAAGMLVRQETDEGVIVENPGTGFAIGQVKWHSFDPSGCTIQSLFTNEAGTIQEYQSTSVSLNAAETQLTIGQAIYNRE